MKYEIDEIYDSAIKIGLSKNIAQSLVNNLPNKRSSQQNKALHMLFTNMSYELNNLGLEHTYRGLNGKDISVRYTPYIVKEFIWKRLQNVLLEKDSTTKLTTADINLIFETLGKWFSEKGVVIDFPHKLDD